MNNLFNSEEIENICYRLLPWSKECDCDIYFPNKDITEKRISKTEIIIDWVRSNIPQENLQEYSIYKNFIFIARISIKAGKIQHTSLQAIILDTGDCDNDDFLCLYDDNPCITNDNIYYYRLDFDINKPASVFTHPYPHIHTRPNEKPRLQFSFDAEIFLPVAFFEFIVLNHFIGKWEDWAKMIKCELGHESLFDKLGEKHILDVARHEILYKKLGEELNNKKRNFLRYTTKYIPKLNLQSNNLLYYANLL